MHTIGTYYKEDEGSIDQTYEWDPIKAKVNRQKHGVGFPEASTVFDDPQALTIEEQDVDGEERSLTLGLSDTGRLLLVVYVWRGERIRIISARQANQFERAVYGQD